MECYELKPYSVLFLLKDNLFVTNLENISVIYDSITTNTEASSDDIEKCIWCHQRGKWLQTSGFLDITEWSIIHKKLNKGPSMLPSEIPYSNKISRDLESEAMIVWYQCERKKDDKIRISGWNT